MKTWDYIERVRARNGDCSDYRIAKLLGIAQPTVSHYRVGRREADDEVIVRIAAALDLPAAQVLADVRASSARVAGNPLLIALWEGVHQLATGAQKAAAKPRAARWSGRQDSNFYPWVPALVGG